MRMRVQCAARPGRDTPPLICPHSLLTLSGKKVTQRDSGFSCRGVACELCRPSPTLLPTIPSRHLCTDREYTDRSYGLHVWVSTQSSHTCVCGVCAVDCMVHRRIVQRTAHFWQNVFVMSTLVSPQPHPSNRTLLVILSTLCSFDLVRRG